MLNRRSFMMAGAAMAGLPHWAAAAEEAIAIPFQVRMAHIPRIVIDVMIGGQGPYGFVLDTGGITSIIDKRFAEAMKLPHGGSAGLSMGGTRGGFDEIIATDVVIGNVLKLPRLSFAATQVINFGEGLVGTLGAEFLTQYPGLIDFDAGVWSLYRTGLPALDGYARQDVGMARGRDSAAFIFAKVMLNGVPVKLALDTGFPGEIRLTPQALKRTGLDRPELPVLTPAPGFKTKMPAVRAASATLEGIDLGQPVVEREDWNSDAYPDGIMGIRLIPMFNFAVDARTGDLWIKRSHVPRLPNPMYPA